MRKNFIPDLHGRAALVRIDHGDELTWDKVADRITGYGDSLTKRELELVVGYLAASILKQGAVKSPADLLADLAATREADQKTRFDKALRGARR